QPSALTVPERPPKATRKTNRIVTVRIARTRPRPSLEVAGRLDEEDTPVHGIREHGCHDVAAIDQLRPVHEMSLELDDPEVVDVEANRGGHIVLNVPIVLLRTEIPV